MKVGVTRYIHQTAQAVDFYMKAFGLSLGYHVKNEDGTYLHGELIQDGKRFSLFRNFRIIH